MFALQYSGRKEQIDQGISIESPSSDPIYSFAFHVILYMAISLFL